MNGIADKQEKEQALYMRKLSIKRQQEKRINPWSDSIIDKLTGKAAVYITGIINAINT